MTLLVIWDCNKKKKEKKEEKTEEKQTNPLKQHPRLRRVEHYIRLNPCLQLFKIEKKNQMKKPKTKTNQNKPKKDK